MHFSYFLFSRNCIVNITCHAFESKFPCLSSLCCNTCCHAIPELVACFEMLLFWILYISFGSDCMFGKVRKRVQFTEDCFDSRGSCESTGVPSLDPSLYFFLEDPD